MNTKGEKSREQKKRRKERTREREKIPPSAWVIKAEIRASHVSLSVGDGFAESSCVMI